MKIRKTLFALSIVLTGIHASAATPILGTPIASTERMYQFVKSKNPGTSFTMEMAREFHDQGVKYGMRGDIALCQSCVETGWFRYTGGTAVTPDDHNYCGLGVTTLGIKGCQFSSVSEGISAQLQHLWAYATTKALPTGWKVVDPRFNYVSRGIAPNWENLGSGKWAAASGYGDAIMRIYNDMMSFAMTETEGPSIDITPASVALTGTKGEAAPTVTLTVKGTNLTSDILYNPSTGSVKASTEAGWNARTGGQLTLTMDLSKAAGTYNGYLAVVSGTVRKEVPLQVEIKESAPEPEPEPEPAPVNDLDSKPDPTTLPTEYTEVWNYSASNGKTAEFFDFNDDLTRNMALCGNDLLVVRRGTTTSAVHVIDAHTGKSKGTLPTTGMTVNNWTFSSVATLDDGLILACNLGFSATTKISVYSWKSVTSDPELVMETTDHSGRSGDLMCASGTWSNGKIYLTTNSGFDGYKGRVMVYNIKKGKAEATPTVITLKDASGAAYDLGGTFAVIEIHAENDGTLRATGVGGATAWFEADGTFIRQLSSSITDGNIEGSSSAVFSYGPYTLAFINGYKTKNRINGYAVLADVSGETPKVVQSFEALGATGVANPTGVTTALARVDADHNIHMWTLIPKQGIAKYYAQASATTSGVEYVSADTPQLCVEDNAISVRGAEVVRLAVVNIQGHVSAETYGNTLGISLPRGIYVATAILENGKCLTRKFVKR